MPRILSSWLSSLRFVSRAVDGYSLTCDVLAVATIVSSLAAPGSLLTRVLLGLTTVTILFGPAAELVRALRERSELRLLMGTGTLSRVLVVLSAVHFDLRGGTVWWTVGAGALLCLMILGEQALRRPVRSALPQAANLPGWEVALPSVALANGLYAVDTLGVVLVAVCATFGMSQLLAVVAVAVAVVLAAGISLQSVRYLYARNRYEANLPKTLRKLAPVFAFHWQAPAGTAYQASMWLPYLDRLGVPYFVLVRTAANFAEVSRLTSAPVILRPGLEDLDRIVTPSLKVVFYANTAVRNSHMIRFPHLTHIQLNHGDSDKIASVSPTFRQYDRNFVAGQAAIDRFAKHGVATLLDQFVIVGRPQLENVAVAAAPIGSVSSPTVLYSPTWSGFYEDSDYSSLSAGPAIVQALLERGCTVIFRPHPYARRHKGNADACAAIAALLADDARESGRQHVYGVAAETTMSVVDCFNASDAMVSDVSSVVSDYLISGKPFAMAAVSAHGEAFTEEFPLAAAAYVFDVLDGQAVGLEEQLGDMLGADSRAGVRARLKTYYLGDAGPGEVVERFVSAARGFLVTDPAAAPVAAAVSQPE